MTGGIDLLGDEDLLDLRPRRRGATPASPVDRAAVMVDVPFAGAAPELGPPPPRVDATADPALCALCGSRPARSHCAACGAAVCGADAWPMLGLCRACAGGRP